MKKTGKLILEGKTYDVPIIEGSEGEKAFDITDLRSGTSYITYDPGYGNTGACKSSITFIDGEKIVCHLEVIWSMFSGEIARCDDFLCHIKSQQITGKHRIVSAEKRSDSRLYRVSRLRTEEHVYSHLCAKFAPIAAHVQPGWRCRSK